MADIRYRKEFGMSALQLADEPPEKFFYWLAYDTLERQFIRKHQEEAGNVQHGGAPAYTLPLEPEDM